MGPGLFNQRLAAGTCRPPFFHIPLAVFVDGFIHYSSNGLGDLEDESHARQYWLDGHVRYSFGLDAFAHLGLGYCRGMSESYNFAQISLNHFELGGFGDIIQIEMIRL